MGTNFYWRHNACSCCGRYDERHICKSMVSFAGYFGLDEYGMPSANSPEITAWQDWKKRLLSGGEIWTEYGGRWGTAEFIDHVEATSPEARRRQYEWMVRNHGPDRIGVEPCKDWLDPEGFSFYGGEFS